jgi:hypothetical protein
MGGRIDAEAGDVFEFFCELPVVRQLEHADAMRRVGGHQGYVAPDASSPCGLRQRPAGPTDCFSGGGPSPV